MGPYPFPCRPLGPSCPCRPLGPSCPCLGPCPCRPLGPSCPCHPLGPYPSCPYPLGLHLRKLRASLASSFPDRRLPYRTSFPCPCRPLGPSCPYLGPCPCRPLGPSCPCRPSDLVEVQMDQKIHLLPLVVQMGRRTFRLPCRPLGPYRPLDPS